MLTITGGVEVKSVKPSTFAGAVKNFARHPRCVSPERRIPRTVRVPIESSSSSSVFILRQTNIAFMMNHHRNGEEEEELLLLKHRTRGN